MNMSIEYWCSEEKTKVLLENPIAITTSRVRETFYVVDSGWGRASICQKMSRLCPPVLLVATV
jgi:hypothetical protein